VKRILTALAVPLSLAACIESPLTGISDGIPRGPQGVPDGPVRVADVSVRPDRLTLRLSDGARCVANRPEGLSSGWTGITSDCGYALPFSVTFRQGGEPSRFAIEESFGAVTPDGRVGARAEVYVTDVDGIRKLFIRPMSPRQFEVAQAPVPDAPAAPDTVN